MDAKFLETLLYKHQTSKEYPPSSEVCQWVTRLMLLMFPEQTQTQYQSVNDIKHELKHHERTLVELLTQMQATIPRSPETLATEFMKALPSLYQQLVLDVQAIVEGDPAARSEFEVIRAYPGFYAIVFYRLAHQLYLLDIPLLPRVIAEYAHSKTGIDIHPGAQIGSYFYIDHGTGIVIGETAIIGDHVKLYQGVTLGALSVSKDKQDTKRHPTIESHVIIYAGATILGGETIVGHNSVIGGNAWLTESVPPYTKVYHKAQIDVRIS
ncbi:MAG: serine O-acetyltransferase [Cytophagaceae bacterium]|jgi:serine O-acetyltransferase|nr:serine O-acetyltransferase [Cytophagaceae bacterium]